ncbi:preprotein translocase subunit SecE [Ignavigranum ruoffiae]|uniref:Protein translocase subunit SecE n=1 Tax=Ignavigranum ruoffiae TaxID=89093 RepID=A0A1H9C3L7_9LACT|nr:preprotein translocase subunit SecE [Ignavigranum ruoffiae]UPQ86357.1 preprotein translocase subunit SecE [Ignavigranum ruoffiae]SEP95567.1 preprotein translocase subunit SecE [Ignavigranum ruoffiae]
MSYFKNVLQEMKKVTWPNLQEVNRYTWTVIFMVIAFSIFFAVVDFGLSNLLNWLFTLA